MKYSQRHGQQKGMFFNIEVVKSLNYNICSCHYYHECISLGGQLSFQYFPTSYGDMLIWGDQELFYCSNEGCTVFFRSLLCGFFVSHLQYTSLTPYAFQSLYLSPCSSVNHFTVVQWLCIHTRGCNAINWEYLSTRWSNPSTFICWRRTFH